MTVTVGGDPANLGFSGYARANQVGDPSLDNPSSDEWFSKAAFAVPVNQFGTAERNSLRAPSFWNVDMGLQKNITVGRSELQLRLEAFNVFNHINEGNPNTAVDNVNFARITSMVSRPRQLQLGARLSF